MSERGPVLARFEVSAREQRVFAWVRGISALLALAGACALLLGELPLPVFAIALLALLIAAAWLGQAVRARRASSHSQQDALIVHADGLSLDELTRRAWVPWRNVERVEVDEERLEVVVIRRGAPALRIEPRYPGVDLYQLVRTLDDARQSAHDAEGRA